MFEFVTYGAEKLQIFLMVSIRAAGMFVMAPILGDKAIPPMIKAGFAIILAIVLIPVASKVAALPVVDSNWHLLLFAIKEFLVGAVIGLFFTLLFVGVRMAGDIVGYQIGLMMANIMDPNTNTQHSLVSEFYYLVAVLIFLAIDGHHAIVAALADSFRLIPIGALASDGVLGEQLIRFTAHTFIIGLKVGAPVIVTLFMTSVTLGVVARTVPQMNIFLVGIPLKIIVGFAVMAVALPITKYVIHQSLNYLNDGALGVLSGLRVN